MQISFIGDVSFTGNFGIKVIDDNKSSNILSSEIINLFKKSDYTVCNLEGPLTTKNCVLSTKLNVKSPLESLPFLSKNHINVFGLANNHMFDAKHEGFIDTINELNKTNSIYFGAGNTIKEASKTIYLNKDNIKIAIIGVGHNVGEIATDNKSGIFTYKNETLLKKRIEEAKNKTDWVIIFYHTGAEYNFYPTPTVRKRLKKTLEFGADIIVAHHPHVMQGIETFDNNKTIIYSLGNFIFDLKSARKKKDSNIGLITTINFEKKDYNITTQPVDIDPINAIVKFSDNIYKEKLKKISDFSNYHTKISKDAFRVLFLNPLLPKKINLKFFIYLVLLPFIKLYKIYITSGFDREFVDITLKYYKLSFLKQFLKKDEKYKTN